MTVTINGTDGVSKVAPNAVDTAGLQSNAVTQPKVGAGVAGSGPAFSASLSADQVVSSGVWTKIACNTEQFDTANAYDSTTNYRFQPTVAGYYQINLVLSGGTTASYQANHAAIYKNGSQYCSAQNYLSGSYYWGGAATCSVVLYLNGSTDYIEGYGHLVGGGTLVFAAGSGNSSKFSGALVRAA